MMGEDNYNRLPNSQAIASFNNKTLMTTWHYLDMLAQEHAVAFTVAKMMDKDMLTDVYQAMLSAQENGTTFNEFKNRLKPYLMSRGWWGETITAEGEKVQLGSNRRLRLIYDTNKRTARASGRWQRYQRTKDYFPYIQYLKTTSENKRLDHKRYYGLVLPVDHVAWQYIFPPNGYGCKCGTKQLTQAEAEAIGISEDFELEFEEVENKRTGKMEKVPKGLDRSFAHNQDRLTAVTRLALDRHGSDFVKQIERDYLASGKYQQAIDYWMTDFTKTNYLDELEDVTSDFAKAKEKYKLTDEEYLAIRHYTNSGYIVLKELLTGNYDYLKELNRNELFSLIFIRELLNKALAKMPIKTGTFIRWTELTKYELSTFQKDKEIAFHHFTSTSHGKDVIIEDRRNTRFVIYGRNGRVIEMLSDKDENEVLFMSPTTFKVRKVIPKGDYTEIILIEVVQ